MLHSATPNEVFYATKDSAGFDICSSEELTILPGEWVLVPTGLRITQSEDAGTLSWQGENLRLLPELQIRPRSGLAVKFGVTVLNAPSTIDADYRGEIKVPLINHGKLPFQIKAGDRIAQGVCNVLFHAPGVKVLHALRGEGGFGSTGVSLQPE